MPRQARKHVQQRFDLYPDDEMERKLHERLKGLARKGLQRIWILNALRTYLEWEQRNNPLDKP